MTQFIPLNLSGNNLGVRHRQLNTRVKDAFQSSVSFESIQDLPEATPVDRLFKIALASKYRNIDYIIKNLKDPDMLFVSKALKCTWLLESEYKDKINANYLENELFPQMMSTAVCKMQHWLQQHLRDPDRCKDFYTYYKEKQFKIAIKFLWHCSNEYLLEEFKNIMDRIGVRNLKVLSERCPQLTKIFYENLEQKRNVLKHYLDDEKSFFFNIKHILKSDPETFFNVVEKYFNVIKFNSFGPDITKHIMVYHRKRFFYKPEFYTAWLLNIHILAKYLSPEEVKEVVLKLARAEYLGNWFTYQKVEPLIKRLNKDERVTFKNLVFVDKNIGDKLKDWPYTPPSSPIMNEIPGYSLFKDKEHALSHTSRFKTTKRVIKKRKGPIQENIKIHVRRTLLDDLFDRYRFMSFEATFSDLRKRLKAESNLQNREFMMLVLVSKSGGREESLRTLFGLLSQYKNEPVHFRAAIVRSLVKRAFVWRLPDDLWDNLQQWAHGMGLDGGPSEINCTEGVHATVLRNLLTDQGYNPVVTKLFFDNFTYFNEYSLSATERRLLRTSLPKLLLEAAVSKTGSAKQTLLEQLLSTLGEYHIRFDKYPGVIEAIATAVQEDRDSSQYLLIRLYNAGVARKQFFKENFSLHHDIASYMNALRHDISVIHVDNSDEFLEVVEMEGSSSYQIFLRKLIIYFAEPEGLAEQFHIFFKQLAETKPHNCLAKPLCLFVGKDFITLLKTLDSAPKKSAERRLAVALRANAHSTRPRVDLKAIGWRAAGAKAIANLVCVSPKNQLNNFVNELLTWGRTTRLAITLTDNEDIKITAYKTMVDLRPGLALKMFLRYLKVGKFGSEFIIIWNTVKSLITDLDLAKRSRLCENLKNIKCVPASIKPEYCVLVYQAFTKLNEHECPIYKPSLSILFNIENICYDVNKSFFCNLVNNIIVDTELLNRDHFLKQQSCLYIRLIIKYILLCDSEESQKMRMKSLEHVLQRLEEYWKIIDDDNSKCLFLDTVLEALKYNKVFFDVKYVSCMPVFERVLAWLHGLLTIEKWFDIYIKLHLTMLYYKVARICISQKLEYFTSDLQNLDKGIDMFGNVFGKLLARGYEELQAKYFQTIREIYREVLIEYFYNNFDYISFDHSKERFVIAVIKSILEEKDAIEAHFLASHMFVKHEKEYFKYGLDLSDIKDNLKELNNNELRFCLQIQF
ncbi:uncharacterized protein LOC133518123 [Cydia pomonella]|uniref:uncharacterized protein LOC133518123 n=1 Tax=Cydia pomonella TaxID=82600 RepID=UPI002ADD7449|nr:uncharacterized protein LOC133518123 [Cydia pomonella]